MVIFDGKLQLHEGRTGMIVAIMRDAAAADTEVGRDRGYYGEGGRCSEKH